MVIRRRVKNGNDYLKYCSPIVKNDICEMKYFKIEEQDSVGKEWTRDIITEHEFYSTE